MVSFVMEKKCALKIFRLKADFCGLNFQTYQTTFSLTKLIEKSEICSDQ